MKIRTILLGAAACAALAAPAFAQSDAPKKHHESLENRLNKMEEVIEDQQAEIKALKDEVAAKAAPAPVAEAAPAEPEVSTAQFEALQNQVYEQSAATRSAASVTLKKGRPTIATADGKNSLSIRADVMADYAAYTKSAVTTASLPAAPALQQLRNGFNFRRAQAGIEGKVAGDFGYRFIYDFGGAGGNETGQINTTNPATPNVGAGGRVKEMWVSYTGVLAPFTFKVGAGPWPANLNDATSSDDLLLDERPTPAQLSRGLAADDGRYGLGFIGNGDIWNASTFLTGDSFGKGSINGQSAVVSRVAVAPMQNATSNFNLHLGGNFSYVFKPEETASATFPLPPFGQSISFSDRPELRVTDIKLINTGGIAADNAYTGGLEFGLSYMAALIQSEYFWYGIGRHNAAPGVRNPNFHGFYVEGSYVLTGEPRAYSMASASFARPSPAASFNPGAGNWGAWEIAARYSNSDLNFDLDTSADAVKGGVQNIWSAGVNFYPNDNIKFMFDWQDVSVVKATIPTKYDDFVFRTQLTL
jgi:phosphate-selective porin OprO and OprP